MLIPAQQQTAVPSAQPAAAARKRLGLILVGGVVALAALLIVLPIVFWPKGDAAEKKGETTEKKGDGREVKAPKPDEPAGTDGPQVFVDEDFRTAYEKRLTIPDGWDEGEAFRVVKDNELHALEVGKATGVHFVKLPPVNLSGDFFIDGVYLLASIPQAMTVSLENRGRSSLLTVVIDCYGKVVIGDDARSAPPEYKPQKPTHFLIQRQGKKLRILLDKHPAADKNLDEVADYNVVRIGLTADAPFRRTARLYGIRVGALSAGDSAPPSNMRGPEGGSGGKKKK
jgi:hypothetical protein